MTKRYEDLVRLITTTANPFDLVRHMDTISEGLTDLQNRLEALERKGTLTDINSDVAD